MPHNKPQKLDYLAGYASCPDAYRAFSRSVNNQIIWMKRSEETIRDFILEMPKYKKFRDAYSFLAQKRHQIADDLGHKSEENRTNYYGSFRGRDDHFRQTLAEGDCEQYWKWQKNKIFELAYKLIDVMKEENVVNKKSSSIYEDEFIKCQNLTVSIDNNQASLYSITIKFPYDYLGIDLAQCSKTLSLIELYEFNEKKLNTIRIEYTPINSNTDLYYEIANREYQSLISWQVEDGVELFFKTAGNLAFLLANLLLVKQGNTGIAEWLIRGIAYTKGISIGRFNHSEGISWDFKAILTPNREEFSTWFYKKAFINYDLLNKDGINQEFHFE